MQINFEKNTKTFSDTTRKGYKYIRVKKKFSKFSIFKKKNNN